MRQKVAVLGCGPAGLLAAHAAARENAAVDIYSHIQKSRIGGAQYLYIPVPGITGGEPDAKCTILKVGTPEGYARKVYGDRHADTSWHEFDANRELGIWNMREAYEQLWGVYGYSIIEADVTPQIVAEMVDLYDHIFCCMPKRALCLTPERHTFVEQKVTIDTEDFSSTYDGDNWIEYNGDPRTTWYRASSLFGHRGYEYPTEAGQHGVTVAKPLANNCDCWENWPKVMFLGRYGKWRKGELIHHAFVQAQEALT